MFKKIGLIVLFIVVTLGVAYLLYRFFFAPSAPVQQPGGGTVTQPGGGLPSSGPSQPGGGTTTPGGTTGLPPAQNLPQVASGGATATTPVSQDLTKSPKATSGGLNYYDATDGHFYRVQRDGTVTQLSSATFPQASDVVWSPQGNKAVIEFPDASKVIYDFTSQKQVTLPSHWEDPTWTGDGGAVVAKSMTLDPDNRWLISMQADGSATKLLEPLGDNGDKVTVSVSPDNNVVAFSATGDAVGFDSHDLLPIGQNGENFKSMRVEGFDFTPLWSPDDRHIVYSTASRTDAYLPTLWFQGANGDDAGAGRVNLGVHTWADKCTFTDATTVICAVPDTLPQGAGLQRNVADNTPDHLERIDLTSGTSRILGRPATDTTIDSLTVSQDGSLLYYLDAGGHLAQMRLR